MACCRPGGLKGTPEEESKNRQIEKKLEQAKKKSMDKIKLLLLGAGESGKSTLAKQMKIIHLQGYQTEEERLKFRRLIYGNILENTKVILEAAEELQNELNPENREAAKAVFTIDTDQLQQMDSHGFGTELGTQIKGIWNDPAIKSTYERASDFQLNDTASFFFQSIERISAKNYVPTIEDILKARQKTTGIAEIDFTIGKYQFGMTDVGGQRSERRKWIHCFDDVTAIIFCAALSEYDQRLYEDRNTNRMLEALKLFRDITNSRWFSNTPVILFLNKKDLFEEKIKRVPLTDCFKDYKGSNTYDEASKYIQQQFLAQCTNRDALVYPYLTCATDTENISFLFKAVKDIFITAFLDQLGLMNFGGGGGEKSQQSSSSMLL